MEARAFVVLSGEHGLRVFRDVEIAVADLFECVAHILDVILGEVAGIRPGVGEDFMFFIKSLGDLQRTLGGEGGFALERGKIVKLRRDLGLRFFLLGDRRGLAVATLDDGLRELLTPNTVGAAVRLVVRFLVIGIRPFPEIVPGGYMKGAVDFEIRLGLESLDLFLAGGEDGEGRCLHAACGGDVETAVAGVETGQRAGCIEADEPIRLGAALRGIGERAHLLVAAEIFPCLHDRSRGHRPHPKALDRLVDAPELHDVSEN